MTKHHSLLLYSSDEFPNAPRREAEALTQRGPRRSACGSHEFVCNTRSDGVRYCRRSVPIAAIPPAPSLAPRLQAHVRWDRGPERCLDRRDADLKGTRSRGLVPAGQASRMQDAVRALVRRRGLTLAEIEASTSESASPTLTTSSRQGLEAQGPAKGPSASCTWAGHAGRQPSPQVRHGAEADEAAAGREREDIREPLTEPEDAARHSARSPAPKAIRRAASSIARPFLGLARPGLASRRTITWSATTNDDDQDLYRSRTPFACFA